MGQKGGTFVERDSGTEASERICLHNKKKEPRFYVIKSKWTLTVLTRVVFLVLTLFSAGVITTSIWLMMDCRESFATVRPMLPRNIQFCTNMGMPALFSCCTVLFAIFGLGCTGRRLTGYALIIISSVEILQSVTALTFYKCNTMSRKEVMGTVNSSLFPCYAPSISVVPFVTRTLTKRSASSSSVSSFTEFHRPTRSTTDIPLEKWSISAAESATVAQFNILQTTEGILYLHQPSFHRTINTKERGRKNLLKRQDIHVPLDTSNTLHAIKTSPHRIMGDDMVISKQSEQLLQYRIDCTTDSLYFVKLSQKLNKNEINKCVQVCMTYKAVCPTPNNTIRYSAQTPPPSSDYTSHTGARLGDGDHYKSAAGAGGTKNSNLKTGLLGKTNVNSFEARAESCGYSVYKYVSDLCYYDNKVILPISLCAPFICIGMSACFIYLAYCDRRLKEECQSNIFIQVHEESNSKSSSWSISECCRSVKNCFQCSRCNCQFDGSLTWARLVCCSCCTSSSGNLRSECSTSTHELLHLRTLPSSVTVASALTPEMSQYTLNTSFSDDRTPILPRRS